MIALDFLAGGSIQIQVKHVRLMQLLRAGGLNPSLGQDLGLTLNAFGGKLTTSLHRDDLFNLMFLLQHPKTRAIQSLAQFLKAAAYRARQHKFVIGCIGEEAIRRDAHHGSVSGDGGQDFPEYGTDQTGCMRGKECVGDGGALNGLAQPTGCIEG